MEAERARKSIIDRNNYWQESQEREEDQSADKKTIHLILDNFPLKAEIFQPREAMNETLDR